MVTSSNGRRLAGLAAASALMAGMATTPAAAVIPASIPAIPQGLLASDPVTGPDGALWFSLRGGRGLLRVSPEGALSRYPVPAEVEDLEVSGGRIWFIDRVKKGEVAHIGFGWFTPDGALWRTNADRFSPMHLALGAGGALWFTTAKPAVGRIGPDGQITLVSLPALGPHGWGDAATAAADGSVWSLATRRRDEQCPQKRGNPRSAAHADDAVPADTLDQPQPLSRERAETSFKRRSNSA